MGRLDSLVFELKEMLHQPEQMSTTGVLKSNAKICVRTSQAKPGYCSQIRLPASVACFPFRKLHSTYDCTSPTGTMLCKTSTFPRAHCPCTTQCLGLSTLDMHSVNPESLLRMRASSIDSRLFPCLVGEGTNDQLPCNNK